jgi:superfamily II DNA helicase RecQ
MPLLSLIEDNLNFVTELGIPACSLSTATNTKNEEKKIGHYYSQMRQITYKIVYITPEKLLNSPSL